ncbi:hypothetical protein TNCV_1708411 [Trichonephila clavipes]|nr:hypothetical protein TNCV_1708411 [Trichonephila clavipes]
MRVVVVEGILMEDMTSIQRRRREKSLALDRENLEKEPWMERTGGEPWIERRTLKDLVRDWSGEEGKTINAGGVGELE